MISIHRISTDIIVTGRLSPSSRQAIDLLSLWRPLFPYGWYSHKASCARPG